MVFSVVVNCPCSVTNTKCKPNIVCHLFVKDFGHHRFTMLKVLSLTKGHFTHGTESSWPVAHFKHSHWWKRWRWSKFVAHYTWGTNRVRECKMDVNYMDSYMASNGSCFVVTWTIFKNRLLEVGLTQNWQETMALRTLTTVDLFYYIMCEDPHE